MSFDVNIPVHPDVALHNASCSWDYETRHHEPNDVSFHVHDFISVDYSMVSYLFLSVQLSILQELLK